MTNQLFNPISIDLLLNPVFLLSTVIVFIIILIVFCIYRKRFSKKYKVLFSIILAILIVYFIFILWAIIGFGSSHGPRKP